MTLYLLAGGNDRDYDQFGSSLSDLILSHNPNPKILDVFFAVDEPRREYKTKAWDDWYTKFFGDSVERQFAKTDSFISQIEWANVIYFHGGTTSLLVDAMAEYDQKSLIKSFTNKIIVGSSAGANFLTTVNHGMVSKEVQRGSGIVPVAIIVHFGVKKFDDDTYSLNDWQKIIGRVKAEAGDMPIILQPEGTFTSIEL